MKLFGLMTCVSALFLSTGFVYAEDVETNDPEIICGSVTDKSQKEACFKTFSSKKDKVVYGAWSFSASNKVGDVKNASPSYFVYQEAIPDVRVRSTSASPFLIFGCSNGSSRLLVNPGNLSGVSGDFTEVTYWTDTSDQFDITFERSSSIDSYGLWSEEATIAFLNSLQGGKELNLRFKGSSYVYYSFFLNGLENIREKVAENCKWK